MGGRGCPTRNPIKVAPALTLATYPSVTRNCMTGHIFSQRLCASPTLPAARRLKRSAHCLGITLAAPHTEPLLPSARPENVIVSHPLNTVTSRPNRYSSSETWERSPLESLT